MDFNMQIIFMILTLLQMFVPIQCNFTRKLEWNSGSREKSGAIYRFTAGKGGEGFENKYPPRDYDKMSQTPHHASMMQIRKEFHVPYSMLEATFSFKAIFSGQEIMTREKSRNYLQYMSNHSKSIFASRYTLLFTALLIRRSLINAPNDEQCNMRNFARITVPELYFHHRVLTYDENQVLALY